MVAFQIIVNIDDTVMTWVSSETGGSWLSEIRYASVLVKIEALTASTQGSEQPLS